MIKQIQAASLALFLLACSSTGTMNLSAIVAQIQSTCGFVTTVEEIAKVAVSLVAEFNSGLGGNATVADGIANTIIDSVCGQVKAKASTAAAGTQALPASPQDIALIVNGILIKGHMQGK